MKEISAYLVDLLITMNIANPLFSFISSDWIQALSTSVPKGHIYSALCKLTFLKLVKSKTLLFF